MNKDTIHDLQMLVWNSSNAFADMRLLVEGAITLWQNAELPARNKELHKILMAACERSQAAVLLT